MASRAVAVGDKRDKKGQGKMKEIQIYTSKLLNVSNGLLVSVMAALMPFCAASADGVHTNGIANGAANWCVGENYSDGIVPQAGDVVIVSNGFVVTVADAASMDKVSKLSFVIPQGNGKIVFNVPEGQVWTNSAAVCSGRTSRSGCLEKTGGGELYLNSFDRFLNGNYLLDYSVSNLVVSAGTLRFRQKSGNREYFYGNVSVANNAVLVLNTNGGTPTTGSLYMIFDSLSGEGDITSPTEKKMQLRISNESTFAGRLTGGVTIYTRGRLMLTGKESTMTPSVSVFGGDAEKLASGTGIVGAMKLGKSGEASSLGTSQTMCVSEGGGGFRYLGTGETTDKMFTLNKIGDMRCPGFFDAGANGGVTFTGNWGLWGNPQYPWIEPIIITGSNTTECVMSNKVVAYYQLNEGGWTRNGTNYAFNIVKRGSGAWRFANNNNPFWGGFSIDEGILRYDTIDETNLVSSLGKGGAFYDDAQSTNAWEHKVDYCFRLGNENLSGLDKTEGTLEYTGVQGSSAGTRTFALKGHGRLLNNTATRVRHTGFKSISSGNHILTLDGTGLNTNEVFNIEDGTGTVSVVKTGVGTWALGGDTTFSGSLDVRDGTLLVYPATTNYTWFLWTIRALGNAQQIVKVGQFGLYDADGVRLNEGLAYNEGDYSSLAPGQVAYRSHYPHHFYNANRTPNNMFLKNQISDSGWMTMPKDNAGTAKTPKVTDPTTWLRVVMRLPQEDSVVDSYDLYFLNGPYTGSSYGHTNPKSYTVHGSTDGLNWDELHDVQDNLSSDPALNGGMPIPVDKAGSATYWVATSNAWVNADATCHQGHAIRGAMERARAKPLCNVSSVSVSGGGVLKCVGNEKIELQTLAVDCSAAAGTVDGFKFAETGTLKVTNLTMPKSGDLELPVAFKDVEGLSGISGWTLNVNGKPGHLRIRERGGRLRLVVPGVTLTFR